MSLASDILGAIADGIDPPKVPERDVFALLGFEPNEGRQREFLEATEWDVGYGGAAGGGKTVALLMAGLLACERHPGIQVWCFRRSYPELRDSLIRELEIYGHARSLGAVWKASTNDLTFPNGSVMRFRYCESMVDATRYQGAEIQLLLIDERTLMDPAVVDFLYTRVRSGDSRIPVLGVRSGTNPGGLGHGAFKARYVTATSHGTRTYCDGRNRTVRFIPARITDNPKLNPEYEADLDAIADAALRSALKDGNWDTFAGQFFTEWNRERHVCKPFEVPRGWRRVSAVDWGWTHPHCVLWGAWHDSRLWVYRERYASGVGEGEVARRILDAEGRLTADGKLSREPAEVVSLHVADPSMWGKVGDAAPIALTFVAQGVPLIPANNDRQSGWQRIHTLLAERPACEHHRSLGWDTCPGLHVFETCEALATWLPAMIHDPHKPEDVYKATVPGSYEDDAPDTLRYLVMALPVPGVGREPKREPETIEERIQARMDSRFRKRSRSLPEGA